ncbi:MAG: hypothetical protein IT381_15245 [Deltaproteobacteria bacterium]|nr:hypothetical protein [Deltaproteobacteria bacterium]
MSAARWLVVFLSLSSVFAAPACRCGKQIIGGDDGGTGDADLGERANAYRAGAGAPEVTVCPGQALTLGALDYTDITYTWEPSIFLSDASAARPTFVTTQPGVYNYVLTIDDGQGHSIPSGVTVTVAQPPGAVIESDRHTVCAGGALDFNANASFAGAGQTLSKYSWDFDGDGTVDASEADPGPRVFPAVGTFGVRLTVEDNLGCTATETRAYPICDAPTATFSITEQRVSESSGTVLVIVTLDAPSQADIVVPFTLSGTAAAGADYNAAAMTITIPAGSLTGSVQLTLIDDALNEPDGNDAETIVLTLQDGGGVKAGTANNAHTITIADNDLVPVLVIQDVPIDEDDGTATFTVTLSEPSGQVVTVDFATAPNTANCLDYTHTSGSLTFAPGETTKQIVVGITEDALNEDLEAFVVNLTNPVHANLLDLHAVSTGEQFGGRTPSVVFGIGAINDNDAMPILSVNNQSATEQNPPPASTVSAAFTISLNVASGRYVTAQYSTADASANNGSDYAGVSGLVVLAPAQATMTGGVCTVTAAATTSLPLTVPIVNNVIPEATETFTLDLSLVANANVGTASGIGTIFDDDPKPMITADSPYAREVDGSVTFTVSMATISQETVTVQYNTTNGTALAGTHFTALGGPGTVTFLPGIRTQTVNIPGPLSVDRDRFFFLSLFNPNAGRVQPGQCFVGTILDNGAPSSSFSVQDLTIGEAGGTAKLTIVRGGSLAASVNVDYNTSNGSALANVHYVPDAQTLVFGIGEATKVVSIPIIDDAAASANNVFFLNLTNATGGATISRNRARVRIIDNDPAMASDPPALSAEDGFALEDWGLACVTVVRAGRDNATTSASFATSNGTATAPADYASTSGTITFDPFEAVKAIGVPVVYDTPGSEPAETFNFGISAPSGGVIARTPGIVTILDVDGAPTLTVSNVTASENDGDVDVTISLTGSHLVDLTVDYNTVPGTATAASDYVTTGGPLTFTIFDFQKTITIPLVDNNIFETQEAFTLVLSNAAGPPGIVGGTGNGTITVNDDDAPPVFTVGDVTVGEGAGNAVFTIQLSRQSQVPLSVNYATSDGSARSVVVAPFPIDFSATSGTLPFPALTSSLTVNVPINDDTNDEDDETFTFTLSGATGATGVAIGPTGGTGTGTITDNDNPPQISADAPTRAENATPMTFTLTLDVASAKTVTVDVTTQDGTAVAGQDYTATSTTVTFLPGQTSRPVTVALLDDTTYELPETITLALSNPTNASIATPASDGTITENEAPPAISVNDVPNFAETDGATKSFTVTLSRAASFPISVSYTTVDQQALAGSDYDVATGVVTFAAGEVSKPVPITITNDSLDEAVETFRLQLSAPSSIPPPIGTPIALNAGTCGVGCGVGTITDDDPPPSLSISAASGAEGATGTTGPIDFTVTLSTQSGQQVQVQYVTVGGSATQGTDYALGTGTLTFNAGVTMQTAQITVIGDDLDENNEQFSIYLCTAPGFSGATAVAGCTTAPQSATVGANTALGTITDDDNPPSVSINDVTTNPEGNAGTTTAQFTVTLSTASGRSVSVDWTTADESALAGQDYNAVSGTLTIPAGSLTGTIDVPVRGDLLDEFAERYFVDLSNLVNLSAGDLQGDGNITDDDAEPTLSITDLTFDPEGSSGAPTNAQLTVTLSAQSGKNVTVYYVTQDGVATTAANDYTAVTETLVTFAPGTTTQQVTVPIFGDVLDEANETFLVRLCKGLNDPIPGCTQIPGNSTVADDSATVTITDDDATPSISINNVSGVEGASGATGPLTFTLTLSAMSGQSVSVRYDTGGGNAAAGTDYVAVVNGLATIPAGSTTVNVTIVRNDDPNDEVDETFNVTLSNPVNVALGVATGIGTIIDDDDPPTLTIADNSGAEGLTGTTGPLQLNVTLSIASGKTVTVAYTTSDDTALAGLDYNSVGGTLTFAPGSTVPTANSATGCAVAPCHVIVAMRGDAIDEIDEQLFVDLSGETNATIADGRGVGTITDDDLEPTISIADLPNFSEGSSGGNTNAQVVVTLSAQSGKTVTVNYTTANGNALSTSDYTTTTSTLTFPPGTTTQTIDVPVRGDALDEVNETFAVNLSVPGNATILDGNATVTILDDDAAPTISIDDVTVTEGDAGTVNAVFTVSLSTLSGRDVTFNAVSADGTTPDFIAAAPGDYTTINMTGVTIAEGLLSTTVTVQIAGDTVDENNEAFTVALNTLAGATAGDTTGLGTINDDDNPPQVNIQLTSSANEGATGTTGPMTFTVTVSPGSGRMTSVQYATSSGTAMQGSDYVGTSGTLTFDPNDPIVLQRTQKTITVVVNGDNTDEDNETFIVTLSNPTNLTINNGLGTGTITDDDNPPTLNITSVTQAEGDAGTSNFVFTVSLTAASGKDVTVNFTTQDGTALASNDYAAQNGTITFPAGNPGDPAPSQTITVVVSGDLTYEGNGVDETAGGFNRNQTFTVVLSGGGNYTVGTLTGTGTITDTTDPKPTIQFAAAGQQISGSSTINIPVTLNTASEVNVSEAYSVSASGATQGVHFSLSPASPLSLPAGSTSTNVQLTTTGAPNGASVTLTLGASPVGATLGAPSSNLTDIVTSLPVVSFQAASVTPSIGEGAGTLTLAVQQVGATAQPTTIPFSVTGGTAVNPADYSVTTSSPQGFANSSVPVVCVADTCTFTIQIPIVSDNTDENNETIIVTLGTPTNAQLAPTDTISTATITDDDRVVIVTAASPTVAETVGNATVNVTLDSASGRSVSVMYYTVDGTAQSSTPPVDFTAIGAPTLLTFAPGVTSMPVTVAVNNDNLNEASENFQVRLCTGTDTPIVGCAAPTNACTGAGIPDAGCAAPTNGTVTITDNDTAPSLSIDDVTVTEPNAGTVAATFTVTMNAPSGQPIVVRYATSAGTALSAPSAPFTADYVPISASGATDLTFSPGGSLTQQFTVTVNGDLFYENPETFFARLCTAAGFSGADAIAGCTAPTIGTVSDNSGQGTITDNDAVPSLVINDVSGAEGATGTTGPRTFIVTQSAISGLNTSFTAATSNNTTCSVGPCVIGPVDIVPIAPTVFNIPAGSTTVNVVVTVNGDSFDENDETFNVDLTLPVNATIADALGLGTITNDDNNSNLSIADVSQLEGASGPTGMTFTVTLSQASARTVTVNFTTNNNTATAVTAGVGTPDYATQGGSLTFNPGVLTQTFTVPITADAVDENDETYFADISGATNAGVTGTSCGAGCVRATGTIQNDDNNSVLTIAPVTQQEGAAGPTGMTFTVTLAPASGRTVTVNHTTSNGTAVNTGSATPGTPDYSTTNGGLSFAPGVTTQTFTVPITSDAVDENDETFNADISGAVGATVSGTSCGAGCVRAIGTIQNDDNNATLSIAAVSQLEGASGPTGMTFTITLSQPTGRNVSVNYATSDGSAVNAGSATPGTPDYTTRTGTASFTPGGALTQQFTVPITSDNVDENNESFNVDLSAPVGASISAGSVTGTIQNDDNNSTLSISVMPVTEGNAGTVNMTFTVTLSQASGRNVSVNYATSDGTATATGSATPGTPDYTSNSGGLSFLPGDLTKTFIVLVNGDTVDEVNETITGTLSANVGAGLGTSTINGTINDDDNPPTLTITSVTLNPEGNSGTQTAAFTVQLSAASALTVTADYLTVNGTAQTAAPADYVGVGTTTLTWTPGQTTKTVNITVNGDTIDENNEDFFVNVSNVANATPSGTSCGAGCVRGTATITDDDDPPEICINNTSVGEGDPAANPTMTFTVSLTLKGSNCATLQQSSFPVSVTYQTTPGSGTAIAGTDYTTRTATVLNIGAGSTSNTFTVTVLSDLLNEDNETFTADLTLPTNATIFDAQGIGTINDNDPVPTLTIANISPNEGNGPGTTSFNFTVTLSAQSGKTVTVQFQTADGTASSAANLDFTAQGLQTLTFPSLTTTQPVTVAVTGETLFEANETFFVQLTNPSNATLAGTSCGAGCVQAQGTITNDDTQPTLTVSAPTGFTEGSTGGNTNMPFTVTLSAAAGVNVTATFQTNAGGTASTPGDYGAVGATGITIAAGSTSTIVNVPIVGDTIYELNETVFGDVSAVTNATPSGTSCGAGCVRATGTIADDENPPSVAFSFAGSSICEGADPDGAGVICLTGLPNGTAIIGVALNLNGSSATGMPITVPFTLSGTATNVTDYAIAPGASFTVPAGSTSATATLNIAAPEDTITEGGAPDYFETAILTLGAGTSPAAVTLGAQTTYTLNIYDNDRTVTVTAAETLDTNQDGQIDLMRVVFSDPVTDNTFPGWAANGGGAQAQWSIATYSNVTIAYGTSIPAGITDTADDNTIYLRFTPKATPDTGATPQLSTTATPGLISGGVPVSQVPGFTPADKARPIIMSAIGESGLDDIAITFSENVSTASSGACSNILSSADLAYNDVAAGSAAQVTNTNALDINGCNGNLTLKVISAFSTGDLYNDQLQAVANQIWDLAAVANSAPTTPVTITGIVHPYVLSAVSTSTTTVQVTFSQAVSVAGGAAGINSALNYNNYPQLIDTAPSQACHGTAPAIAWATGTPIVQNSPTTFTLTTNTQKSCNYRLTVKTDDTAPAANGIVDAVATTVFLRPPKDATFAGNEQFRVVSARSLGLRLIEVTFNKPYQASGINSALLAAKYAIPTSLGTVTGVSGATGSTIVTLTHSADQCANTYTVIGANTDTTDGFNESVSYPTASDRPIKSSGTPAPQQNLQASPRDRAFFNGAGTQLCGPMWFDPFTDGSDAGTLANYGSRLYIGPNRNGNTAARCQYDGTFPEVLSFGIAKDTNAAGGGTHLNTMAAAPVGPTANYVTFGHAACTNNSSDALAGCGPDNEDGRGVFNVTTLAGVQYLIAGGSKSAATGANFDYVYTSNSTTQQLSFFYQDLGNTTGGDTNGLQSVHNLSNSLFLGFARGPSRRPDLSRVNYGGALTATECFAGGNCDVNAHGARMFIGSMNYFGRCWDTACGADVDGAQDGAFPPQPNGAHFVGVDSMFVGASPLANVVYLANGGHPAPNRDGAIIRSVDSTPDPCGEQITGTPAQFLCNNQWTDVTPRGVAGWTGDTTGQSHFSLELTKTRDFNPGDKAFPQWATFNGNVYIARNVCRMNAIAGNPTFAGNPSIHGAIPAGAPANVDFSPALANDGQHNGMFTNCVNGDTNRRAQLWKCTPTGAVGSQVCDAGNWTLIDGGGGGTGILDGYTDFGGAGTGNRTMSMVVANGPFLYVAFDNPTTGIQIWRTSNANPTNEASGWTQLPPSGLTNALGLPDPTNQRYIYSAISVIDGSGTPFLYMATGRNGYPVSIYRFDNN